MLRILEVDNKMKINLKKIVENWKLGFGALIILTTIVTAASGFWKLPGKVEKQGEEIEENKDEVNKLAGTVDKYIGEQRIRADAQHRRFGLPRNRRIDRCSGPRAPLPARSGVHSPKARPQLNVLPGPLRISFFRSIT